ncbi:hypothetical protein Y032_0086g1948 [Ancylostoma ceylanicum]|nr:hypothetical protein Y032_0086g1948 [Ancylostoma ceylanicum]
MQCGFAFLEAGAVRSKNTTNILIKNLLDSCIAIIGYWSLGWAFAYGDSSNNVIGLFIGHTQFFLAGFTNYPKFFFQYVFAATSATIVSGAVAERCEFANYITYCTVISTFVYPILTHWGWHPQGWMYLGIQTNDIHTTYLVSVRGVNRLLKIYFYTTVALLIRVCGIRNGDGVSVLT